MEATLTYALDVQSGKKVSGDGKSSQGVQKTYWLLLQCVKLVA